MKVAHIITGLTQGGAENVLYRLVTYNNKNIHNIVISLTDLGHYGDLLKASNIEVFTLGMPRSSLSFNGIINLVKILRKEKPEVVQTWMYHADLIGGVIAKLIGIKYIYWGIVNYNLNKFALPLSTRIIVKICSIFSYFIPSKIISCSKNAITIHRIFGYSNKFVYIPLGFNVDEIVNNINQSNISYRKIWNVDNNDILIGCVARWDPQKDHKNLLLAFNLVLKNSPNIKCVFIGPKMNDQNIDLMNLINKICEKKENLILAGTVDNIACAMSELDIHVLPSIGEAFPNVVAEAMACKIPCIVTEVGDAPYIVDNLGWVIKPSNHYDLASTINIVIEEMSNKNIWNLKKESCRSRIIENYSLNKMANSYEKIWFN